MNLLRIFGGSIVDIAKHRKIAKRLLFLFLFILLAVSICCNIYVVRERMVGNNPITMSSGYFWFSILLVAVVYLPLLSRIHYHAKMAGMKKLRIILCILIVHFTIALIMVCIFSVLELLNPGMFT